MISKVVISHIWWSQRYYEKLMELIVIRNEFSEASKAQTLDELLMVLATIFYILLECFTPCYLSIQFSVKLDWAVVTASMLMIWASWKSLVRIKLRPKVAETRDMTEVLSRSVVWYLGSGMSPMKRKIVAHKANAAYIYTTNIHYITEKDDVITSQYNKNCKQREYYSIVGVKGKILWHWPFVIISDD